MIDLIDTQKLSQAITNASTYPAALKQLQTAWVDLLNTVSSLGIPICKIEAGGYRLEYNVSRGRISHVYAITRSDSADSDARALIVLVPVFVEYLEGIAKTARDATVVADAIRQALADERVQAALAMRALEK
jgi:hypothetical protein